MKWRVLWRLGDFSLALKVCDDLNQAKRAHDERERLGNVVWIENAEGRAVPREELDRVVETISAQ